MNYLGLIFYPNYAKVFISVLCVIDSSIIYYSLSHLQKSSTLRFFWLVFNRTLSIYGWMPAHITLVTGVFIVLVNIGKIFKFIKYLLKHFCLRCVHKLYINSIIIDLQSPKVSFTTKQLTKF